MAEENEGFPMLGGACEMGKFGLGGLKRNGKVTFNFRTTPLDIRTACKMVLGA